MNINIVLYGSIILMYVLQRYVFAPSKPPGRLCYSWVNSRAVVCCTI